MFHPLAAERIDARPARGEGASCCSATRWSGRTPPTPTSCARGYEDRGLRDGAGAGGGAGSTARRERLIADPHYRSHSHQHHGYLQRGRYVDHLERLEKVFGRDRIHVVDSHRFFTEPESGLRRRAASSSTCRTWATRSFEQHNARPRSPMAPRAAGAPRGALRPLRRTTGVLARTPGQLARDGRSAGTPADVSTTASRAPERVAGGAGMPAIARGGALNLIGAGVAAVAGVLLVVVITRSLPQEQAGVFFALTSVFLIAEMVARLGTGTGLVYFVARLRTLGRGEEIRAVQRVALIPVRGGLAAHLGGAADLDADVRRARRSRYRCHADSGRRARPPAAGHDPLRGAARRHARARDHAADRRARQGRPVGAAARPGRPRRRGRLDGAARRRVRPAVGGVGTARLVVAGPAVRAVCPVPTTRFARRGGSSGRSPGPARSTASSRWGCSGWTSCW